MWEAVTCPLRDDVSEIRVACDRGSVMVCGGEWYKEQGSQQRRLFQESAVFWEAVIYSFT